jgi:hypothetical protein
LIGIISKYFEILKVIFKGMISKGIINTFLISNKSYSSFYTPDVRDLEIEI